MKKILVYVDAENVSGEEIISAMQKIKDEKNDDEVIIGKFYGGKGVLHSLIPICYQEGLEFVETSSLLGDKKNLTDMKIVVDCITDVAVPTNDRVACVHIISNDCDFIPLCYKLIGFGVRVHANVFVSSEKELVFADVENFLRDHNFDPVNRKDLLTNLFDLYNQNLPQKISHDLITRFINKKRRRFEHAIKCTFGESLLAKLYILPSESYDFLSVCDTLRVIKQDEVNALANVYSARMFGVTLSDQRLRDNLDFAFKRRGIL